MLVQTFLDPILGVIVILATVLMGAVASWSIPGARNTFRDFGIIITNVFIPCIFISHMIEAISIEMIRHSFLLFLFGMVSCVLGYALGVIVSKAIFRNDVTWSQCPEQVQVRSIVMDGIPRAVVYYTRTPVSEVSNGLHDEGSIAQGNRSDKSHRYCINTATDAIDSLLIPEPSDFKTDGYRTIVIITSMLQNTFILPMSLCSSLIHSNPDQYRWLDMEQATAYIFFYGLGITIILWSVGPVIVRKAANRSKKNIFLMDAIRRHNQLRGSVTRSTMTFNDTTHSIEVDSNGPREREEDGTTQLSQQIDSDLSDRIPLSAGQCNTVMSPMRSPKRPYIFDTFSQKEEDTQVDNEVYWDENSPYLLVVERNPRAFEVHDTDGNAVHEAQSGMNIFKYMKNNPNRVNTSTLLDRLKATLGPIMNGPLISTFVGIFIGLITPLRDIFIMRGTPLGELMSVIKLVGNGCVPGALFLLGANLSTDYTTVLGGSGAAGKSGGLKTCGSGMSESEKFREDIKRMRVRYRRECGRLDGCEAEVKLMSNKEIENIGRNEHDAFYDDEEDNDITPNTVTYADTLPVSRESRTALKQLASDRINQYNTQDDDDDDSDQIGAYHTLDVLSTSMEVSTCAWGGGCAVTDQACDTSEGVAVASNNTIVPTLLPIRELPGSLAEEDPNGEVYNNIMANAIIAMEKVRYNIRHRKLQDLSSNNKQANVPSCEYISTNRHCRLSATSSVIINGVNEMDDNNNPQNDIHVMTGVSSSGPIPNGDNERKHASQIEEGGDMENAIPLDILHITDDLYTALKLVEEHKEFLMKKEAEDEAKRREHYIDVEAMSPDTARSPGLLNLFSLNGTPFRLVAVVCVSRLVLIPTCMFIILQLLLVASSIDPIPSASESNTSYVLTGVGRSLPITNLGVQSVKSTTGTLPNTTTTNISNASRSSLFHISVLTELKHNILLLVLMIELSCPSAINASLLFSMERFMMLEFSKVIIYQYSLSVLTMMWWVSIAVYYVS